jgi:dTDP-4-amino-4,6-dideoxygalactose transaminase
MIPIAKPLISEEEIEEVKNVLTSGRLIQGEKVEEFEKEFSKYIGVEHAVATSNGTTALHTALLACGITEGDEVITTPFSFIASSNSILFCRAKPVFVDIDTETFNINPDLIEAKITKKTKAILVVHLYGMPVEMDKIMKIAEEYDLLVIEDACQAHGAEYKGKKVGSIGHIACFSFYPTKNMTTGEGGMITTNDDELCKKARMIRNHGQAHIGEYLHRILGYNYRMTDMQAAIGLVQLKKLESFIEKRIEYARYLNNSLMNVSEIVTPKIKENIRHVFHQYTVRVLDGKRDYVAKQMEKNGIQTRIYYPLPIYKQPLYRNLGYREEFPEAEQASKEVLSLPVHPSLSKEDLDKIIYSLKSIINNKIN